MSDIEIIPPKKSHSANAARLSIFSLAIIVAVIVVGVWILGMIFRFAAWLLSGLLYVAAIVVIVAVIAAFFKSRKAKR